MICRTNPAEAAGLIVTNEGSTLKIILTIITTFTVVIITACANIKSEVFNPTNHDKIFADISKSNLSDEDKRHLMAGVMAGQEHVPLDGKSVQDVVAEDLQFEVKQAEEQARQKTDAAEQEARQKAATAKEEARIKAIEQALKKDLTVTVLSKGFSASDSESNQDAIRLRLKVDNWTKKTIKAYQGVIGISDAFGTRVTSYNLTNTDTGIGRDSSVTAEYYYDYNQFDKGETILKETPMASLHFNWKTEKILFEDGTKLILDDGGDKGQK